MATTKASMYLGWPNCRHTRVHYLRCQQHGPRCWPLSRVIHIKESYSPEAVPARVPVPERAVPGCRTPLAPGVPPSWRAQGGVTSLAFPQGSHSFRESPAGCSSAMCRDSALPQLSCPGSAGILGLSATGMAPVCQGYQGTWTCPQHPQVRHLGISGSRSESALGWRQSRCSAAAYRDIFLVLRRFCQ